MPPCIQMKAQQLVTWWKS